MTQIECRSFRDSRNWYELPCGTLIGVLEEYRGTIEYEGVDYIQNFMEGPVAVFMLTSVSPADRGDA